MKRAFIIGVISSMFLTVGVAKMSGERVSIGARAAYFMPTDSVFKDVYGGGQAYGGEVNARIFGALGLWLGADYYTKKGKLTFTGENTELTLTPISGGVRYTFGAGKLRPYVGAGVAYVIYKETSAIGSIESNDVGFLGLLGTRFIVAGRFFLDVQARYSTCKAKPGDLTADLGGLQAGLGLGIAF